MACSRHTDKSPLHPAAACARTYSTSHMRVNVHSLIDNYSQLALIPENVLDLTLSRATLAISAGETT